MVWEDPDAGIKLLFTTGEGAQIEFKAQLPEGNDNEARRTMLKMVAAFASGNGGTVLYGVSDDGTVAGLDPATVDQQRGRLVSTIRDLVTPEFPYDIRLEKIDDRTIIVLDVRPGQAGPRRVCPVPPQARVLRPAMRHYVPGSGRRRRVRVRSLMNSQGWPAEHAEVPPKRRCEAVRALVCVRRAAPSNRVSTEISRARATSPTAGTARVTTIRAETISADFGRPFNPGIRARTA